MALDLSGFDQLGGGGGGVLTAAGPPAPPSGGGGLDLSRFDTLTAPAPASKAPTAAKKGGGGGILGSIGRAITGTTVGPSGGGILGSINRGLASATNFINPIHTLTSVVPQLAVAAGTDAAHLGELAIGRGPLAGAVAPSGIPGFIQPHAPLPVGEGEAAGLQKGLPFLGGVGHAVQQTGRYGAGGVQGVAGIGAGPQGRLGRGLQHEAASQFAANPFNAAMNVAGTAALVAPAIGGALAGGATAADAAATAAEGEAATAAAGVNAGTVSAEDAAAAADRASTLRSAADAAKAAPGAQLGAAINKVGEGGRAVMEAPFAPLRLAIRGGDIAPNVLMPEGASVGGLAGFARGVAGAEDAGPLASRLADTGLGRYAAKLSDVSRARAIIRGTGPEGAGVGIDALHARQGQNLQFQRDTAAAAGGNPDIVQAAINREAGMAPGSQVAQRAVEHGIIGAEDVPRVFGDPRVQALAAGQGTPAEEAAIGRTADVLRAQAQARQEEELAGVGRLKGPMNPEQAGTSPLTSGVSAVTQGTEEAAQRAEAHAAALRAAGPPTTGLTLPPLSDVHAEAIAKSLGISPDVVRQQEALRAGGTTAEMTAADQAATHARTLADQTRAQAEANPANAPARYRPSLLGNANLGATINAAADAAEKITPGAGADVRALAEGLPQTTAAMNEAGIDPTHFTGPGPVRTGEGAKPGETLPRRAPLASEKQKVVGVLPTSVSDIRRTEDIRARQIVANLTVQRLTDKMGTVATEDGVATPGMVGFNPASIFQKLPDGQIKAGETILLPKPVLDTFARTLGPDLRSDPAKVWDSVIRGGKDIGVAMSPSYWAAVVLADSVKALAFGKGGTLETLKAIPGAVDIIANHADNPFYGQLVGRGLSTEQAALTTAETDVGAPRAQGGPLHRAAAPFWKATSYVQSVQRLSVALADIAKGASPEEAVADARRVMGVFDNLTHTEQNIRRFVPGVAFYKHITTLALSLPLDSSARMAWLGYLYNAVGPQKGPTSLVNPGGVLGGLPSLAPPIRYGMEVGLGMHPTTNIAKSGGLTSPIAAGRGPAPVVLHGSRALPEAGYLATQLFTPTRGLLAGFEPNVPRYQTGEALKTGTPYPGGRLGGVLYGLGLSSPTPAAPKTTGGRAGRSSGRSGRKGR